VIQYIDHVQWSINILEAKMISSRTDETPDEKIFGNKVPVQRERSDSGFPPIPAIRNCGPVVVWH
jgi:hypothetical protein